jgi:dTDP-4-amino-4,6-dideoxygalactose transaminase
MWNTRISELQFDGDELAAALETIESEWITAGGRTQAFEEKFAQVAGTSEAVAVSNGTAALILALKGLDIGPGDEVLCPSMTFAATAAAIIHCGATPVFVDIIGVHDPTMDPDDAAAKITPKTRAILPMHYAGIPCHMDAIEELARQHGLVIVEDAAHAPGAAYKERPCGSLGSAGCFSLYANKNITTAEGGVITTNDPGLAQRLRLLRCHGMTSSSWDREQGRPAEYDVVEIGFNFRFDDIRAAIGLAQLKKLGRINESRARLTAQYNAVLSDTLPQLVLPFASLSADRVPAFHIYPVVFESIQARNEMEASLREQGIQTSIHYRPVHLLSAFQQRFPGVSLPRTESYGQRELTLPLYPAMTTYQVKAITVAMRPRASRPSVLG